MAVSEKKAAAEDNKDVQKQADEINEKGYIGWNPDPHSNDEYTLQTGPDSPPYHDAENPRTVQHFIKES